jgi:hypothetical protein
MALWSIQQCQSVRLVTPTDKTSLTRVLKFQLDFTIVYVEHPIWSPDERIMALAGLSPMLTNLIDGD